MIARRHHKTAKPSLVLYCPSFIASEACSLGAIPAGEFVKSTQKILCVGESQNTVDPTSPGNLAQGLRGTNHTDLALPMSDVTLPGD